MGSGERGRLGWVWKEGGQSPQGEPQEQGLGSQRPQTFEEWLTSLGDI